MLGLEEPAAAEQSEVQPDTSASGERLCGRRTRVSTTAQPCTLAIVHKQYTCEHCEEFKGTYDVVKVHETSCGAVQANKPICAPAPDPIPSTDQPASAEAVEPAAAGETIEPVQVIQPVEAIEPVEVIQPVEAIE